MQSGLRYPPVVVRCGICQLLRKCSSRRPLGRSPRDEAGALRRPGAGAEFGKSAYIRRYIVKKQRHEKSPLLRCL